jgi:DNA-binding NarL/FixJ family response regulator
VPVVVVGRLAELASVVAELGRGAPVVVAGEAGIGKTTVLRRAAADSGRVCFFGGAYSTLTWMDHLPLTGAVGRPVRGGDATSVAADVERVVGRGVLVVDDVQWADPGTLKVLALLAGRVAMMVGLRTNDLGAGPVGDALRLAGFERVELGPLGRDDAVGLARALRPDLASGALERMVANTGGNPFLLCELASTGTPSPSLRAAIAARLRGLDSHGRRAFEVLAAAGRPLDITELGRADAKAVVGADLADLIGTTVAVRHALIAEVALAQLGEARLAEIHALLARLIHDDGEAARHHALAGERQQAHERALRAANRSERPGERAAHLALAARCAEGAEADELHLGAARALGIAEDWGGVESVLERVSGRDPTTLAWVELLRARASWYRGDDDAVRRHVENGRRLASRADAAVSTRLHIEACAVPIFLECDWEAGVVEATSALAMARRTGVDIARAQYFLGTAMVQLARDGWQAHLRAAVDGARESGDIDVELRAAWNLVSALESSGPHREARLLATEMIERSHALGLGIWENGFRAWSVNLDFHSGQYASGVVVAEELLAEPLDSRTRDQVREALLMSLIDLGRLTEATRLIDDPTEHAVPDHRGDGQLGVVRAELALASGRPEAALRCIDQYLEQALPGDANATFGRLTRAWTQRELGADPGPAIEAQVLPILRGAAPESEGLRLLFNRSYAAAAEQFEHAAALWRDMHRRGELRCLWAAGDARVRAGDIVAGLDLLDRVGIEAAEHGMNPLSARIRQSLRAAGARGSMPRGHAGGGLSAREAEVLELVAEGLSNVDIGRRLRISPRTVEAQIRAGSAKLAAGRRAHAASLVVETDVEDAPFVVIEHVDRGHAAVDLAVASAADRGARVVAGFTGPNVGLGAVCVGAVSSAEEAAAAVLAAVHGARLVVIAEASRDLIDRLCDDLRRIGAVHHEIDVAPAPLGIDLTLEQRLLIECLLDGATIGEAATQLNLSRRTAARWLAALRADLAATSTSEVLAIARRAGMRPPRPKHGGGGDRHP